MRAVVYHGRGDVRVEDVAEAAADGMLDALVDVELCGLCGTDVAEVRDGPVMTRPEPHPLGGVGLPVVLGHELVGTLAAGGETSGLPVGARVTVDACLRCGACAACLRGDYHRCRLGGSVGLHAHGALASRVAVPSACLVAVPDGVTDAQAALTEPFAVALHALDRAGLAPADGVLVLGFGPVGAACAVVARALGARPLVVEPNPARRERAAALGLPTLDAGADLPRRARRALGGGGAEVVVESTGVAAVLPDAIDAAARGGAIVLVGIAKEPSAIDTRRLVYHERTLVGSLGYRHDLPRVLALVASGALDPAALVSATIGIDEAPAMLARLGSDPGGLVKVLVDVRG